MKDPFVQHIENIERRYLEGATATPFDLSHLFHEQYFLQIRGLTDFWSQQTGVDFVHYMNDLVISAHNQSGKFLTFVLAGTPSQIAVYVALGDPEMARTFIEGGFPGIKLVMDPTTEQPLVITDLATRLSPHAKAQGVISGIPGRKTLTPASTSGKTAAQNNETSFNGNMTPPDGNSQGFSHLERVIRGMSDTTWVYIVQTYPRMRETVMKERHRVIDDLATTSSHVRGQIQKNTQTGQSITASKNTSYSEVMSGDIVNYRAQYLVQLLEHELMRHDRALAMGQWMAGTYFGAATDWDRERLASLLVGTMASKDSRPDPLRVYRCRDSKNCIHYEDFKTHLSSDEVATLIQLPREEVPGYAIHDLARFDVDFPPPSSSTIDIGMIQQQTRSTHEPYRISLDDLTKHAAIFGVTGSGKTTTILNLLDHIVQAGKPFLVIEPAKTEYRPLRPALTSSTDIRIYTPGNEVVAPFRFNPFEFETGDTPGSGSVLNHIDVLKAVFNAAFILYAPMPYVLDTALHEIYADKGWDLASGRNTRLPDAEWINRHRYTIFPTLTDLYRKVEDVTTRLRYDREIELNVIAGLKARVGSLRLGSKGFMLDTARGIPMATLLSVPTILELENIGNDDEKTFLMGLLLSRLYEYRRLQSAQGSLPGGLQHILVFEEAHRLLKQTQTQVDVESANPRAQAIETFTNMLSEMRGYGQGAIIAEQIPSKLAPDVLKNTNLKIAHRLVAQDDRQSVGHTMNLNRAQITHLGVLSAGMAAIYAEGADHAYLVKMDNYRASHRLQRLTDTDLASLSAGYASVAACMAIPQIDTYGIRLTRFNGPDMATYQTAGIILESEDGKQWWASVLLHTIFHRSRLQETLKYLYQMIASNHFDLQEKQQEILYLMIIVRGVNDMLAERGAEMGWTYAQVEELRAHLTRGLITLLRTNDLTLAASELDSFARKYRQRLERKRGPFAGCKHCQAKCVYRPEVSRILSKEEVRWIDDEIQALARSGTHDYRATTAMARAIAEQWMEGPHTLAPDIGYCGSLHAAARLNLPPRAQAKFADEIATHLL